MYEGDFGKREYVPGYAREFYRSEGRFSCEAAGLAFDSSGNGTWTVSGSTYPIVVTFDEELFLFSVHYNTDDERDGYLIFEGEGTEINENTASYTISFKPNNIYDEAFVDLTIVKTN